MQAVLISINPNWCGQITLGIKKVEVRKTKPKLKTPFKVLIYCSEKDYNKIFGIDKFMHKVFINGNGKQKVIGEFVCDRVNHYTKAFFDEQETRDTDEIAELLDLTRLTYSELCAYVGLKDFYGWHISNLVIYDKPRELSEFSKYGFGEFVPLKRPPQSWCYVEV